MAFSQHASLIQDILNEQKISNLAEVSDARQLEIYRLALVEIKKGLEGRKPRDLPDEMLIDDENALHEISVAFYTLRTKSVGKRFRLDEDVVPHVDNGLAHLGRALEILEGGKKTLEYQQCLLTFRNLIFQVCRYLEPGSTNTRK